MILNKYNPIEPIQKHNFYDACIVGDEYDNIHSARWINGIEKDSRPSKMLREKLHHLKKATHPALPKIIEYDWDQERNAYCIIYENKDAKPLNETIWEINPAYFLRGIINLINCLQHLLQKHGLAHGNISPTSILVDQNLDLYLIDVGIADILEEFTTASNRFTAPEKLDRNLPKAFPHHSDVFSIGKIIDWYFELREISNFEAIKPLVDLACKAEPQNRINYNSFSETISTINTETAFDDQNFVHVEGANQEFLVELNDPDFKPRFDVWPRPGENILLDISTRKSIAHCMWLIADNRLLVRNAEPKETNERKYKTILQYGKKLGLPIKFISNYNSGKFNLTPFFKKIQKRKQHDGEYREGKREISKELKFFKNLLNKEKEVLEKNSLRLYFESYSKEGVHAISFKILDNQKLSTIGSVYSHIDKSTPPHPEEFEYILSATTDKKQMKDPMKFSGIAYNYNRKTKILRFKDCERLNFDKIPQKGYLIENISKQEEEKKRQLEAIRKVEYNEAHNKELIHFLFNPSNLEGKFLGIHELNVFQKDEKGKDFIYSGNQKKAIINGLHRKPLTIVQGPPGTGKTTVITEIVFQILSRNPESKILITSQTNDAVDNVLDNLLKKEIPIVRLSGIRQPKKSLKKHTLERKIEGWKQSVRKKATANWKPYEAQVKTELRKENLLLASIFDLLLSNKKWEDKQRQLTKIVERFGNLQFSKKALESESNFIPELDKHTDINLLAFFEKLQIHKDWLGTTSSLDERSNINQKLISSIRVIGATTNHIAAKKYDKYNFEFDYVIMDESGKATTAEALIPLTLAKNAILVGDHRQLRPMLTATKEVESWLRDNYNKDNQEFDSWDDYFNRPSLFEQVITRIDEEFKSQLDECRRSSAEQVILTSKCFYEPFGDEPIKPVNRPQEKEHNLDLKINSSIIFLDIGNSKKSEIDKKSRSSFNRQSAPLIPQILKKLDRYDKVREYSIGIITGYTAQLREIRREVKRISGRGNLKNINPNTDQVAISVVDKFQGLERDIIIFDLVRSQQPTLGFLANANRINVALSRQKRLLIIIGNYNNILNTKPYKSMVEAGQTPALHKYLKALKKEWIVKNLEQIF